MILRRHRRLYRLTLPQRLIPTRQKDLAKQVAHGDVAGPLQRQIDAALDGVGLARDQGGVEAGEVAALDAAAEGPEARLQARVGLQQARGGEEVRGEQAAGDEVGQDEGAVLVGEGHGWTEVVGVGEVAFGPGVVFVEEGDDADVVVEGDLVGFGEEGEVGEVGCGRAERAEDVFGEGDGVELSISVSLVFGCKRTSRIFVP